jgi:hypothetical protein
MPTKSKSRTAFSTKAKSKPLLRRKRPYTVMVYLAGDNNLSEEMVTALKELQAAGKKNKDEIYITACFDSVYPTVRTGCYIFDDNSSLPSGQRKKEVFDYIVTDSYIPNRSPRDINTGRSIERFVKWGAKHCPADKYVLILSGHGDAFRGKTLMYDENPPAGLTISQLRSVLEKAKAHLKGNNFSILGFDNCAMNLVEIGYEFKDVADYLVSSEGFIPQSGWEYQKPLEWLIDNAVTANSETLARRFVSDFADAQYGYTIGGRSVDMAVCNLLSLKGPRNVATALDELGGALLHVFEDVSKPKDPRSFVQELFMRIVITAHWRAQTFFYEQTVDLYDFCKVLQRECDLYIALFTTLEAQISGELFKADSVKSSVSKKTQASPSDGEISGRSPISNEKIKFL